MKQSVNKSDFHAAFNQMDRGDQFTPAALSALFEYLEEYEQDTGEEIDLDIIALCCDCTEDESLDEWARRYFCDDQLAELLGTAEYEADKLESMARADALAAKGEHGDAAQIRGWYDNEEIERADHKEKTLREHILDHGQLIEFDGGIIVSEF